MEYKIAAKWWADKIRHASPANFDNGDKSEVGFITTLMATSLAAGTCPNKETIDLFEKRLSEVIEQTVEIRGYMRIYCDYGPTDVLARVARRTGIPESSFPWKTMMWITPGRVSVSCGHAAPEEVIYPVKTKK